MHKLIAGLLLLPVLAFAHDGHGPEGVHWHATDAWGCVVVGVALAATLWFGRRK